MSGTINKKTAVVFLTHTFGGPQMLSQNDPSFDESLLLQVSKEVGCV
jgi:hypothetical protein